MIKQQQNKKAKLIAMPSRNEILSEKDMQSLFLGLIRLVKNNTIKEMNYAIDEKKKDSIIEYSNLKISLRKAEETIEEYKRENNKLKKEIEIFQTSKFKNYENLFKRLKSKENDNINSLSK
jgi:predicted RNase H-like nuclease (RuvC/YqgF family)